MTFQSCTSVTQSLLWISHEIRLIKTAKVAGMKPGASQWVQLFCSSMKARWNHVCNLEERVRERERLRTRTRTRLLPREECRRGSTSDSHGNVFLPPVSRPCLICCLSFVRSNDSMMNEAIFGVRWENSSFREPIRIPWVSYSQPEEAFTPAPSWHTLVVSVAPSAMRVRWKNKFVATPLNYNCTDTSSRNYTCIFPEHCSQWGYNQMEEFLR